MLIRSRTISSQNTLSLLPESIRKSHGFLMFAGLRERVHWEQMGKWVKLPFRQLSIFSEP